MLLRNCCIALTVICAFLLLLGLLLRHTVRPTAVQLTELLVGPLQQEDPRLVQHIKTHYLLLPDHQPYNLTSPQKLWLSEYGLEPVLQQLFHNKSEGFFLEAGAFDGETYSTTLYLEKFLSWRGILVEPMPPHMEMLKRKHRKAIMVPACLSIYRWPNQVHFTDARMNSWITETRPNVGTSYWCMNRTVYLPPTNEDSMEFRTTLEEMECVPNTDTITVQCLPLYSIIAASGLPHIDFMTLDVEGAERAILNTLPFDRVNIKVILVEVNKVKEVDELQRFMEKNGYEAKTMVGQHNISELLPNDMLFIKSGVSL